MPCASLLDEAKTPRAQHINGWKTCIYDKHLKMVITSPCDLVALKILHLTSTLAFANKDTVVFT